MGGRGGAGSAGALGVARALGMLRAARAPAQVVRPEPAGARAHTRGAGLGRRRRAPPGRPGAQLQKPEEGAGESSRDVRVPGKWAGGAGLREAKWPVIGARCHSHLAQWSAGTRAAVLGTPARCGPAVKPLATGIPLTAPRLGTSGWSRGRRRGPGAAGGREDRKGDEFQNQSLTPTR